jgi:hypothetical protein
VTGPGVSGRSRATSPYPGLINKPCAVTWRCGAEHCEDDRGCEDCSIYRCAGCTCLRHWSNGGTDSELCDACWNVVHAAAGDAFNQIFGTGKEATR